MQIHGNGNNHQLFNICYFTCVTKNKTYQFVLLSHAIDLAGLGVLSWSHKVLVSLTSLLIKLIELSCCVTLS